MLGEWARAVATAETDLLGRRVGESAPVPRHGELARGHVKARALQLQFPRVQLPPVGLAPRFELGSAAVVVEEARDGVAYGQDWGLHVLEFFDVRLE